MHLFRQEKKIKIVDGQSPQFVDKAMYKTDKAVYPSGKYFTNPTDNPPLANFDTKTLRRFAPHITDKKNNKLYYCPYTQDDDYIFLYGSRYLKIPEDASTLKIYHFNNKFILHIAPDKYRLRDGRYDKPDRLKNPITILSLASYLALYSLKKACI